MSEAFEQGLEELVPRYEHEPRRWDEVAQARIGLALASTARARARARGRLDRGGSSRAGGAFHREFVDFFSAEPAPEPIRIDFAEMGARIDLVMGPGHETHEAREVMKFPVDGRLRPLWVAPMENGGFCYRWHTFGSCGRMPHQGDAVKLGLGGQEGAYGQNWIVGHVSDPAIQRLELEYADGERIELRYVWVSSPIDAGFTAFQVPQERQREGRHAIAVIGFDDDGKVIERRALPGPTDPRWEPGADGLPRIADRSKKRTLFDFRDETGARWTLAVAPAPEEKHCYAFNRGGGCVSPRFPATPPAVVPGGKTIMVCCTVAEGVTKVELLFRDGRRIEVEPVDGFLLYERPVRAVSAREEARGDREPRRFRTGGRARGREDRPSRRVSLQEERGTEARATGRRSALS